MTERLTKERENQIRILLKHIAVSVNRQQDILDFLAELDAVRQERDAANDIVCNRRLLKADGKSAAELAEQVETLTLQLETARKALEMEQNNAHHECSRNLPVGHHTYRCERIQQALAALKVVE